MQTQTGIQKQITYRSTFSFFCVYKDNWLKEYETFKKVQTLFVASFDKKLKMDISISKNFVFRQNFSVI